MRRLLLALLLVPAVASADRFGAIKSNADVILTTQAVQVLPAAQQTTAFNTSSGTTGNFNTNQIQFQVLGNLIKYKDGVIIFSSPGVQETFFGYNTNLINNGGVFNTAYGSGSMPYPNTGNFNNCFGNSCMNSGVITSDNNNGMGYGALGGLTGGSYNNAMGGSSMQALKTGQGNVAVGAVAMGSVVDTNYSIGIGYRANFWSTGTANIGIGYEAGTSTDSANAVGGDDHLIFLGTESGKDRARGDTLTNAAAFGYRAYVHRSNTAQLGGQVGSGYEWDVNMASLTVQTGQTSLNSVGYKWPSSQAVGTKILSNDGSGNLSWATDATSAGGGDNLGNGVGSYGVATTTAGFTAFDASATSVTVSGAGGFRVVALTASQYVKTDANKGLASQSGVPTTDLTGTLQAAQEPAHTGDITNSAGSLATTLATTVANDHSFTGNITLGAAAKTVTISSNAITPGSTIYADGTTWLNPSAYSASLPLQTDANRKMVSLGIDLSGSQATNILAAARHPALTGDVTTPSGSIATTIANSAVTLAKMENRATQTFIGRNTAGTGVSEELSIATSKTMLNLTGTNSGDQTITLTGDVTGSGTGSFATTLANTVPNTHTFSGVITVTGSSLTVAGSGGLRLNYASISTGTPLTTNVNGVIVSSSGINEVAVTASGATAFNVPAWAKFMKIRLCAAGGGGAGGEGRAAGAIRSGAGGGGGGACVEYVKDITKIASTAFTVQIGTGGTGGAAGSVSAGGNGSQGMKSSVYIVGGATIAWAYGGGGGEAIASSATVGGGGGGGCGAGANAGNANSIGGCPNLAAAAGYGTSGAAGLLGTIGLAAEYGGGGGGAGLQTVGIGAGAGGVSIWGAGGGGGSDGCNISNICGAPAAGGGSGGAAVGFSGGGGAAGTSGASCTAGTGGANGDENNGGAGGGGGGGDQDSTAAACTGGVGGTCGGGGGAGGPGTSAGAAGGNGGIGCAYFWYW